MFHLSDPLEQFEIIRVAFDSNCIVLFPSFMPFFFLIGFFLFMTMFSNRCAELLNLNNFTLLFKIIFNFVRIIVVENLVKSARRHFPIIYYIFIILLMCNMIGMIPYSFTITSSFATTFYLALGFFIGVNLIGLIMNKENYFDLFLPGGSPVAIIPFLVPIEILSYIARVFSLSIRLFANMMSGHTLLKILAGFSWSLFNASIYIRILFLLPLGIVFMVTGLELAIAFLQAYVFTVLMCIYLNDVFSTSH